METVTVVDVMKKDSGWYEIELEDGRKVATKAKKLADTAFQAKGSEIEVELNEQTKGKYTNIYLNAIGDVVDSPVKSNGSGRKPQPTEDPQEASHENPPIPGPDTRDERIARQWAFGRATELFAAGFTPTDKELDAIAKTAEGLLSRARP